ncbi:TPA: glycine--tRNA ligase subunit beta [Candidatus Avigastranaerophilus faecigallinarum]|nr:glycine--tRNA ligase subunit beta [Candidatus Avigastranaerophilus faecigallinarum]
MNKYLLEIGTEELAYKFIPSAMEQLKNEFSKTLEENEIKFSDIKVYATPRRLAVIIENIAEKQEDIEKTIKGPIANIAYDENGNLTKAAIGFANKNGINPEKLYKQDNYVWAKIEQKGKDTKELLKSAVPNIILKLKGTHFMRWADLDIKFQRPIRWIVSLFNEEKVEIEIANIKSSNITRGHRFSKTEIEIKNPDEYLTVLESAKVIADVQKRKETIVKLAKEKAKEIGAEIAIDEDLLDEVTFITEWPVPVICSFEEKYLQIPEKVVVTVMAVHQRYFPLYKEGKLLNKFITISNYVGDTFENIKAGNERVVKARLEDAIFFVQEDTQKPLLSYLEALKGVTFQKGFGSVYDKTQRICELSKQIAKDLNIPTQTIERTALLCKADLVTKLVFEFTELQGYIGADYALRSGESKEVSKGIMEHYFPLNADSEVAESIEGQVVGIADKIDTVVTVFADGKKISGSQDPLGVRRATLGILKTILNKDLKINITKLLKQTIELLPVQIEDKNKLFETVKSFMEQRLIILLSDKYKHDILEACISEKDVLSDLKDLTVRLDIVSDIVNKDTYSQFHESINRIIRLIKTENDFTDVKEDLFVIQAEKDLYNAAKNINENTLDYNQLEEKLVKIIPFITEFFDKVLVMDKDENIKRNRLNLLYSIKQKFAKLADFSKIVF